MQFLYKNPSQEHPVAGAPRPTIRTFPNRIMNRFIVAAKRPQFDWRKVMLG